MEEQKSCKNEAIEKLDLLNKQISELIQIQRKAASGYDYVNANELAQLLGESKKTIHEIKNENTS